MWLMWKSGIIGEVKLVFRNNRQVIYTKFWGHLMSFWTKNSPEQLIGLEVIDKAGKVFKWNHSELEPRNGSCHWPIRMCKNRFENLIESVLIMIILEFNDSFLFSKTVSRAMVNHIDQSTAIIGFKNVLKFNWDERRSYKVERSLAGVRILPRPWGVNLKSSGVFNNGTSWNSFWFGTSRSSE